MAASSNAAMIEDIHIAASLYVVSICLAPYGHAPLLRDIIGNIESNSLVFRLTQ